MGSKWNKCQNSNLMYIVLVGKYYNLIVFGLNEKPFDWMV